MLLSHFDVSAPEAELRARCDCAIFGAEASKVVEAARHFGFARTDKRNLSRDELKALLAEGRYPIVYVNMLPIDGREGAHALVAIEIENDAVTVYDPDQGERLLPLSAFLKAWELKRNLAIIVEK